MALTVRTNIASINAQKTLSRTSRDLQGTLGRISSGLRVRSAADDAAGLGVATNLKTAQIGYKQAMRNTNDGISVIQTAEGAISEVTDMLQRMRELAVQSSSETLHEDERVYIQQEAAALSMEIGRVADITEFNSVGLTNGDSDSLDVQVGVNGGDYDRIQIDLPDLSATTLGVRARMTSTSSWGSTADINVAFYSLASFALDKIDTALDMVNEYRADLGAVQNRLESAFNSAQNYTENLARSESHIMDADYAYETSEMAKQQIMSQAGVAALSQAKNITQSVVSLLD